MERQRRTTAAATTNSTITAAAAATTTTTITHIGTYSIVLIRVAQAVLEVTIVVGIPVVLLVLANS